MLSRILLVSLAAIPTFGVASNSHAQSTPPTPEEVFAGWGGADPRLDLNQDGVVNGADHAIALSLVPTDGTEGPVIPNGPGFLGVTAEPPASGNEYFPYFDARVIARWNMVPFTEFDDILRVGVVAFHANGIEKVEFSANGGVWTRVNEMRYNPSVGVWEYFAVLRADDFPDGLIELRARVFPKLAGIPRVLQGGLQNTRLGGAEHIRFRNGMHSMWLNANGNGSLGRGYVYASGSGNDTTGDGTGSNPYRTIARALTKLDYQRGTSEGSTVYLLPGEYTWNSPSSFSSPANKIRTTSRYVTVAAAPGVSRDNVRVTGSMTGGLATKLLRVEGITFFGSAGARTPSSMDTIMFANNCLLRSTDPFTGGGVANGAWSGIYATGCEADTVQSAFRSATFVRNCVVRNISDTPIGSDATAINVSVDGFVRNPNGDHADIIHWFFNDPAVRENRIIYGLRATRFDMQAFQANPILTGCQRFDNIALVNIHASKDGVSVAGSWWYFDTNHLLIWNVQFPDQPIRWAVHGQDLDGAVTLRNVSIRNSVFRSFSGTAFPGLAARDTHFMVNDYGSFSLPGPGNTFGWINGGSSAAAVFFNPSSLDYRPKAGSVIDGRIMGAQILVPSDIQSLEGAPASSSRPIGAYAAAAEE